MIDPFDINLYPVLTEDWRKNKGAGFGQIRWYKPIPVENPYLTAKLYIVVYPKSADVELAVRHRYQGYKYTNLGDAKQSANTIWQKVEKELPPLIEAVEAQNKDWQAMLNDKYGED